MSAPDTLGVEVFADGGVRLTTPTGTAGMATLVTVRDWIESANRSGSSVTLTGDVGAPAAAPVVDEIRRIAHRVTERPSAPVPWPHGRSSVQTAAADGHIAQLADLLERGAAPNQGFGRSTPYRLAMERGHVEALRLLQRHGVRLPRGVRPPDVLPDAVVLRMFAPALMWWLVLPFVVLAIVAAVGGAPIVGIVLVLIPLLGIALTNVLLGNSRSAIDGTRLARRSGRRWLGPVDLSALDAVGYAPHANLRAPAVWALGQHTAGHAAGPYERRAFPNDQLDALERAGVRFVTVPAARGFMSPRLERLLARLVDPAATTVSPNAAARLAQK